MVNNAEQNETLETNKPSVQLRVEDCEKGAEGIQTLRCPNNKTEVDEDRWNKPCDFSVSHWSGDS